MEELVQFGDAVEAALNFHPAPGYNPNLKYMSHLWDPVPHIYRPLAFYLVMELLALVSHVILTVCRFQRHELEGNPYYTFNLPALKQGSSPR